MAGLHFSLNIAGIQDICVDVATSIHAQFHVAATIGGSDAKHYIYEGYYHGQNEVLRRRTIELAVNFRLMDERLSDARAWRHLRDEVDMQFTPGRYIAPNAAPLPLRECCNKVVHAKDFRFKEARYQGRREDGRPFSNYTLDSEVRLFGDRGGKPWECDVDLLKLAECIYEALERWVRHDFQPMAND